MKASQDIETVQINNRCKAIVDRAFFNCSGLTSVTIPNSVTSIGGWAFRYCSGLTSVTIGNGVTSIELGAFDNCTDLKNIVLFPSVPPTLDTDSIPATVQNIYVQQSSEERYKTATNWIAFAEKIQSNNIYLSLVRFNKKNKEYIDKKLTAPTTPSAESAVTMLADGTVGTKPLSEIGGSGGDKLYKHSIIFKAYGVSGANAGGAISVLVERYSSSMTPLTSDNFQTLFPTNQVVVGTAYISNGDSICTIRCVPTGQISQAILYYPTTNPGATPKTGSGLIQGVDLTKIETSSQPTAYPIRFNNDTVTEL